MGNKNTNKMGNCIDKRAILDRIKEHYSFKGNADLARFLEVSPNTITNWYKRQTFDIDTILSKCTNLDLNWLLTGQGERIKNVPPFCHFDVTQNDDKINKEEDTNCEQNPVCSIIERNREFLDSFRCESFKGIKPANYEYMQIAYYDKMTNARIRMQIDYYTDDLQETYNNNIALLRVLYSLNPPEFMKDKFKQLKPFDEYYKSILLDFNEEIEEAIELTVKLKDDKLKNILFILYLKEEIEHRNNMIGILINYMDVYNDLLIRHILSDR